MNDYDIIVNRARVDPNGFYGWLINEFIPERGEGDMKMFIKMKFNPYAYQVWKAWLIGKLKPRVETLFLETMKEEYGIEFRRDSE